MKIGILIVVSFLVFMALLLVAGGLSALRTERMYNTCVEHSGIWDNEHNTCKPLVGRE